MGFCCCLCICLQNSSLFFYLKNLVYLLSALRSPKQCQGQVPYCRAVLESNQTVVGYSHKPYALADLVGRTLLQMKALVVDLVFMFCFWYQAKSLSVPKEEVKALCRHQLNFSTFNGWCCCVLQQQGLTFLWCTLTYRLGKNRVSWEFLKDPFGDSFRWKPIPVLSALLSDKRQIVVTISSIVCGFIYLSLMYVDILGSFYCIRFLQYSSNNP